MSESRSTTTTPTPSQAKGDNSAESMLEHCHAMNMAEMSEPIKERRSSLMSHVHSRQSRSQIFRSKRPPSDAELWQKVLAANRALIPDI
eukprot:m.112790 g.112790  ORF g.112790 m.112790 type:complete len:89 (-) comp13489_c1_seq1:522-788(-)